MLTPSNCVGFAQGFALENLLWLSKEDATLSKVEHRKDSICILFQEGGYTPLPRSSGGKIIASSVLDIFFCMFTTFILSTILVNTPSGYP